MVMANEYLVLYESMNQCHLLKTNAVVGSFCRQSRQPCVGQKLILRQSRATHVGLSVAMSRIKFQINITG